MADRLQKIKELMTLYDQAQRASSETAKLRKQLVSLLKDAELTKTKFNFGDRNISFHKYNDYEKITQRLIRSVIVEKYPNIDADKFIADLYAARKSRSIDTLRTQVVDKVLS